MSTDGASTLGSHECLAQLQTLAFGRCSPLRCGRQSWPGCRDGAHQPIRSSTTRRQPPRRQRRSQRSGQTPSAELSASAAVSSESSTSQCSRVGAEEPRPLGHEPGFSLASIASARRGAVQSRVRLQRGLSAIPAGASSEHVKREIDGPLQAYRARSAERNLPRRSRPRARHCRTRRSFHGRPADRHS